MPLLPNLSIEWAARTSKLYSKGCFCDAVVYNKIAGMCCACIRDVSLFAPSIEEVAEKISY